MSDRYPSEDHTHDAPEPVARLTVTAPNTVPHHVSDGAFALGQFIGRGVLTATIDDAGTWASDTEGFAHVLGTLYGHDYQPRVAFHPYGRSAAVATDAAEQLGGHVTLLGDGHDGPRDGAEVVF
jgi:hypothetical protein